MLCICTVYLGIHSVCLYIYMIMYTVYMHINVYACIYMLT